MAGAVISFSASAVAIRELAKNLNVFEILAIRLGFGVVVLCALVLARPQLGGELRLRRMWLHFARNATHFVGQYAWALAVTLLPLATVFTLEFTTPAWVALLATLMLGERMTASRAGSVALGFLGVLVIVRPGLAGFQPMALLVLFAAAIFALSLIATKMLTRDVSAFAIIFWMNLMQLPMTLAWPLFDAATGGAPLFVFRLGYDALWPALALGVVGLTSHYCLAKAFLSGDATTVVPLDFLRIPLIALVGWMLYGETVDLYVLAGAALIIGGILWNLLAESRQSPHTLSTRIQKPQVRA
jgi:drug/metabolite transporter (DMT)-like permease